MMDCDTLLMVGGSFPYSEFLPSRATPAIGRSTSTRRRETIISQVIWEQGVMEGGSKYTSSQGVPVSLMPATPRYSGCTASAWIKSRAGRRGVGRGVRRAQTRVLEAHTDPEVPNNPLHLSFDQAMGFATSTPRDSAVVSMTKGAVGDLVENFLPHKK